MQLTTNITRLDEQANKFLLWLTIYQCLFFSQPIENSFVCLLYYVCVSSMEFASFWDERHALVKRGGERETREKEEWKNALCVWLPQRNSKKKRKRTDGGGLLPSSGAWKIIAARTSARTHLHTHIYIYIDIDRNSNIKRSWLSSPTYFEDNVGERRRKEKKENQREKKKGLLSEPFLN
jgi:hypothetical protein